MIERSPKVRAGRVDRCEEQSMSEDIDECPHEQYRDSCKLSDHAHGFPSACADSEPWITAYAFVRPRRSGVKSRGRRDRRRYGPPTSFSRCSARPIATSFREPIPRAVSTPGSSPRIQIAYHCPAFSRATARARLGTAPAGRTALAPHPAARSRTNARRQTVRA